MSRTSPRSIAALVRALYVLAGGRDAHRGGSESEAFLSLTEENYMPEELTPELAEYSARVKIARLSESKETLYNSDTGHATILIENLFLAGQVEIDIVCRQLSPASYGTERVRRAARLYLEDNPAAQINILAGELALDENGTNPFFEEFDTNPRVDIKVGALPIEFDMMAVDKTAYRRERDVVNSLASGSFNDPVMATTLTEVFKAASAKFESAAAAAA